METAWQRYLETATELTAVTRRRAEAVVRSLVKQGEVAADRAERSVEDLLARSERNRRVVSELVTREVERTVDRLGLVHREELDRLTERVERLEDTEPSSTGSATEEPTGRKPSTRKPSARKPSTKKAAEGGD